MSLMGRNKKKNKSSQKITIPQTVADSIPYRAVYANGLIEIRENYYSRSYKIPAINFKIESDERQMQIARSWAEFIGSFSSSDTVELTAYNETVNMDEFQKNIMIPMADDNLNEYRMEYNNMLISKMAVAKNNLTTHKILTISFPADDIIEAVDKTAQYDLAVTSAFVDIAKCDIQAMSIEERLEMLNSIYNQEDHEPLYREREMNGKKQIAFSLENCAAQGITTKDVIAPSILSFNKKNIEVGNTLARSYCIANYPNWLRSTIFTDFNALPVNLLVSFYYNVMDPTEAIKMTKRQGTNISSSLLEKQQKASQRGYDASLISPDLQDAKVESAELMSDITKNDEKLFTINAIITVFAQDEAALTKFEGYIKQTASKNLVTLRHLIANQEFGFNSSLPLGNNFMDEQRLATTNTVSAIIPFDVKDINDPNGIYYGINAESKNIILYDKTSDINPNSAIFGIPGSGKSFSAKEEIINVLMTRPDDEVYVIDPEGEYVELAKAFGGECIKIANGSSIHINPLDLNLENADKESSAIKSKMDFIATICEIAIGGAYGLSANAQSIIDRCSDIMYRDYLEYLKLNNKKMDIAHAPTMHDLYRILREQPEAEAKSIYLGLERFVTGSVDLFSHHTNVNIKNRFTVYDIVDIGDGLKELGLQICLDNIWNKMIENKAKGIRTWIYLDEFHLLLSTPTSADYTEQLWRRSRKWAGCVVCMTQQLEDMLKSAQGRSIINNCSFIQFLAQSPMVQEQLMKLYGITQNERKYIASNKSGMGLLKIGTDFIPKIDEFPKNTKIYKLITSKPNEKFSA